MWLILEIRKPSSIRTGFRAAETGPKAGPSRTAAPEKSKQNLSKSENRSAQGPKKLRHPRRKVRAGGSLRFGTPAPTHTKYLSKLRYNKDNEDNETTVQIWKLGWANEVRGAFWGI